jgi:hypothetical protein
VCIKLRVEVSRRVIVFSIGLFLHVQWVVSHRDYDLAYSHLFSFRLTFKSLKNMSEP